ncbi:MAG: LamG-like jellyroll fold domain-containing protein, partial [Candidatus Omnitrophota bacterium]|nr:LamG-like jellyroll fold domain-containing protein [Candidatus Omnitrophota bacterium]
MRITQSGNVGLGTTSPGKLLHVVGSSGVQVGRSPTDAATAPTGVAFTESYLHLGQQEFGANSYRLLSFGYRGTQTNVPAYLGFLETDATAATKGALVFGTRNVTTDTAPTERMRIDTAGNVGIGTASPAQKLSVAGTVESTSGGFKFPDGGVQDTAVTSVPGFKPDTSGALTKSLLSYWRFDEGSGTVVGDAKGSTDGTATNGPTIVAGKVGNARSFDGVDDYVNVGSIGIANDGVMTLSTFVYRSGSGSGSLMAHDPNTTAETDKFFADLSINNRDGGVGVGAVTFTVGKINSGHVAYYTDTAALPANQWTHLTVVYTGGMGSGSGKIYVNGQLYSTLFASSGIVSGTTAYDSWKMGKSVNGLIDEVGIWSRALTASEVTDLYNAGSANQYKPGATIGGWVDDGTIVRLSTGSDAVGIGTTSPAATALLDLTSTTKGLLAPRMTTTQRDAITSPAAGLLLYNTTTNAYNVYNGTSWGAVGSGGGSGDVLMTGTNTFTATTASPIKIKPSSAPTADTKLLDLQATGAGTTTFSVDAEGDVVANSLDLTVALPDAELAQIATAGKISGAALTSLASVPAGAGVLPAANTPLGAAIDSTEITDGTIATADVADSAVTSVKIADGAITWAKLNGTTNLTLDANAADLARTLTITNAAADTATAGTPDLTLIVKGGVAQGATTELLEVQNSAAASLFAVEAGGNVGIGTASPAQKLHVEGQCVTGDTLLPILKKADGRRQKAEDEWVVETVAIKDVQAGMLVYSLNEATGTLEPHRINGLLDMGVQPVFRLTTASGRFIRTTGNHPYLVKVTGEGSGVRGEWRKVVALAVGEAIAVPKTINGRVFLSAVDDAQRRQTQQRQSESPRPQRSFPLAPPPSARVQDNAREDQRNAQDAQGNSPDEWKLLEEVTRQAYQDDALAQVSDRLGNKLNLRVLSWLHLSSVLHLIESLSRPLGTSLVYADVMPPATWQPGAATSAATSQPPTPSSDIVWDPIVLIEPVGREPVYDIEVDGTHNFVANGIIAHNTYLNGNVGIGTATPAQKLSVVGTVESTSGGFKFPDASVQDTAVTSVPGFKPDTSGALATNLSNYWNLNESSGTVATDAKGSNDSTVTNGPTWVAGKLGNALSFDGVNDFVDVAPSALTNFTLTAWIKPSANSGANQGILDGELCGQVDDMGLRMTTTGKLEFQHGDTSATAQFDSTATLALNTWTHVAAVRNTSAGNTRLYINGVLDSTFTNVHSRSLGGANPTCDPYPNRWAIGHLYRGVQLGNTGFTGLIDEVGVWSRALIAAEITDLYNAGAGNAYKRGATIGGWTDDGMVVRLSTGSDAVGIGTTSPAATALLDLTSTTMGLLAPRMTTTQRDAITSPAAGLLLYNTTTNAYNVYNGTSWGAVGGGSGDVLTTGTNTFTATTASPIKIKPSSAPTADTKLFDMQATGAGTTNFSVDAEGDLVANSLDLTTPLPDAEVADNITASSYLPLAGGTLTGNLVIPNAGTLGQAAGPLLTFDDTNNELEITGGNVGIGTASPVSLLALQSTAPFITGRGDSTSGGYPALRGQRSGGTLASPTAVTNIALLGLEGYGYDGSAFQPGAALYITSSQTWSSTARGSYLQFYTVDDNSTTQSERMRITQSGNVGLG